MKKSNDTIIISAGDIKFISFENQTEKVQKLIKKYKKEFWMKISTKQKVALVEIIEQFSGKIIERNTGKILTKNEAHDVIFNS